MTVRMTKQRGLAHARRHAYMSAHSHIHTYTVVMDMILEYEEQLNLLQRRFIQQLKDFQ
jgi:hypothetical protein